MRCPLSLKTCARLSQQTGLPIVQGSVRGGTDHDVQVYVVENGIYVRYRLFRQGRKVIGFQREDPPLPTREC